MRHEAPGCDKGVFTDGNALEHNDIDTQPNTTLNCHGRVRTRPWIVPVPICVGDHRIGTAPYTLAKDNFGGTSDSSSAEAAVRSDIDVSTFRVGGYDAWVINADKIRSIRGIKHTARANSNSAAGMTAKQGEPVERAAGAEAHAPPASC